MMAGLSIDDLAITSHPDVDQRWPGWRSHMESEATAYAEDKQRARGAAKAAGMATTECNRTRATKLAQSLRYGETGDQQPVSLASSAHMRHCRIGLVGSALDMIGSHRGTLGGFYSGTIIRQDRECGPSGLSSVVPNRFLNALRMDLYRSGLRGKRGFLLAGVHGEYEPASEMFRPHIHAVFSEKLEPVVRRLKKLPSYRPIYRRVAGCTNRVPSVRIQSVLDVSLPRALSYVVQSFWPSRWEGVIDGEFCRQKHKSRIKEPRHTQLLLWLDQWRLSDMTLLIGASVRKHGLRPTTA